MLRRIQWIWKGLKIKERVGIIDESRSQRKEEGLSSTTGADTSSSATERKEIRIGTFRATVSCDMIS